MKSAREEKLIFLVSLFMGWLEVCKRWGVVWKPLNCVTKSHRHGKKFCYRQWGVSNQPYAHNEVGENNAVKRDKNFQNGKERL